MEVKNWLELIQEKLINWWVALIKMLPNMVLAILVFTAFFFVARLIRGWVNRLMLRISDSPSLSGLFATIAYLIIFLTGAFIALDILRLEKAVTSLLAGAGIIGLVLGFAFQDLSANFISGIFIAFRKPFDVGDIVETNGYLGNVEQIQLRSTIIRTFQGQHLMIPNKDIFQKPMINYSRTAERRIELEFNIPDVSRAAAIETAIAERLGKLSYLHRDKKPEIYFTAIGDTNVRLAVYCWIYNHELPGYMAARHELIQEILEVLSQPKEPQRPPAS